MNIPAFKPVTLGQVKINPPKFASASDKSYTPPKAPLGAHEAAKQAWNNHQNKK